MANTIIEGDMIFMNIRNEIKAYIIREGFTMSELVEKLAEQEKQRKLREKQREYSRRSYEKKKQKRAKANISN